MSPLAHLEASPTPQIKQIFEVAGEAQFINSQTDRTKRGAFYTPAELATRMAEASMPVLEESRTFLDPACGSGIFLLALLQRAHALGLSTKQLRKFISTRLFGIDLDKQSIFLARRLVALLFRSLTGEELNANQDRQIVCGDFLISPDMLAPDEKYVSALDLQNYFPEVSKRGGFDVIIGNPPYGMSRNGNIGSVENKILKRSYADSRRGKVNKYLLFVTRAYDRLAAHGQLLFVLPNAWLGIEAASQVRKLLLSHGAIQELWLLPHTTFPTLGVETVVVNIKKQAQFEQLLIVDERGQPARKRLLSVKDCLVRTESEISINGAPQGLDFLQRLVADCIPMGDSASLFHPMIALQAYATGKGKPPQTHEQVAAHCFHSHECQNSDYLKYLEGRDISRYSITWSGNYLRYGPHLAEPQKLSRFTGPRVLVREILGQAPHAIQACYTDEIFLYNKSVLHILPRPGCSAVYLRVLAAILNSRIGTIIIQLQGKKAQRSLFPKLLKKDLHNFPLPTLESANSSLIKRLDALTSSKFKAGSEIDAEIDNLVGQLYGLKDHEREQIDRLLAEEC
ncbi:MAG: N-6 DNA methylase [Oligoflexia bacterium]|nr:N-6 DNA methylase [Oligoflexia bacterium]